MAARGVQVNKANTDKVFDRINLIFWVIVLVAILYPLWLIIVASVSEPDAVMMGKALLWPVGFSWTGYQAVFQHKQLISSYANSIFYTVSGSAISVAVTMMAAYALTRKFKGKKGVNLYIIITMFFSGGLIPQFLMNRTLGLYNTVLIMIIINGVSVWNLMVARTYISSAVPNELYEAAAIDGADHFIYFFRIVLPLSGTIIAVLAVYYGVARWNDYFTALVYIRDRAKLPLQTILREVIATLTTSTSDADFFSAYANDSHAISEAIRRAQVAKYCCIVVSTVPTVALYMLMQKYFVKGVLIGSLKG
ncbi:carbohydrate ABC transporter permease [Leadbettera azotonutricia]|uniref:Protein LplC n=1 Tax=Leadbettera azotonutricia (strain ATCC BAA-888 / DSM 13862 / ZAS-9) TaxID=545695 RepID=F5YET1_LEAAZ|nr:carbohydrate ABC transporter permease [Leadbettera azotonutricia]AEF80350.1 protein LplC [Leadbettera azotonutricia ZAS-9]